MADLLLWSIGSFVLGAGIMTVILAPRTISAGFARAEMRAERDAARAQLKSVQVAAKKCAYADWGNSGSGLEYLFAEIRKALHLNIAMEPVRSVDTHLGVGTNK